MESNDSLEIPDRGETFDIPGLLSGEGGGGGGSSGLPCVDISLGFRSAYLAG